jgi:hypothetical protein
MAGSRGLSRRVVAIAAAALLALAGHAVAQLPGSQPALPPLPTPNLPPTVPPPAVAPPVGVPLPPPSQPVPPGLSNLGVGRGTRFDLKIEPNTPVKDLLPAAPKTAPSKGPVLTDDLAKVPEAEFQAKPETIPQGGKMAEQMAHQLAKINHLNAKKTDAFMTALLESRPDLAGMPFAMGDDCRTSGERMKQFTVAVSTVRQALPSGQLIISGVNAAGPQAPAGTQPFWPLYTTLCEQQDAARSKSDKALAEHVTVARIAALMQMLAAESSEVRLGLVKYLSGVSHAEATKALARMAIFSPEDEVRGAAIDAVKVRREKDYTDILVNGLRYPWPAVAKRSADAIARIGRTDLIPELIAVLDGDDPRLPQKKKSGWTEVTVVREMVKVNHHRNCAMCHAPAGATGVVPASAITVEVPLPGQPLLPSAQGYGGSTPELMIRVDVTYLRQDFSTLLAVGEAHPWPEMQRFDFLVRERKVTAEEAETYREKLTPKEAGVLSPYHKAALAALRELTGKDTTPTAKAWRTLLDLPTYGPPGRGLGGF